MNLTVFGATGNIGSVVVERALAQGDRVTAVVRDRTRLTVPAHPQLTIVEADVMVSRDIEHTIANADAVVSSLGARTKGPTTIVRDGARSVIAAMEATGVKRLTIVSANGPFNEGDTPLLRYVLKPLVQRVLRNAFDDLLEMEKLVTASSLQWTIVRPPRVTGKAAAGTYRTAIGVNVRGAYSLSKHDLAECLLRTTADPHTAGDVIYVAN